MLSYKAYITYKFYILDIIEQILNFCQEIIFFLTICFWM